VANKIRRRVTYDQYEAAKGVLLFGHHQHRKTLLAKAVATESEANFISIRARAVEQVVGESEKGVARDVSAR